MNRTTVKRGIGAVILALIAAALLAFLLKDKAAQRQEVVEIALPGTGGGSETTDQSSRLPTLTTDNSGNGDVIANAGSGNGAANSASASNGASANENSGDASSGSATSGEKSDGTIIASATAAGAAAAGAATAAAGTAGDAAKSMDFSVKPKAATSKASSEFLDLDLVNNGEKKVSTASTATKTSEASSTAPEASTQAVTPKSDSSADEGVVIASTSARTSSSTSSGAQPRLIDERKSAPIKSAKTATVVTKQAPAKSSTAGESTSAAASQAKNGYAIQLLATSSSSRANNLKKVMSGEGYSAYVTKTNQNGKTLYRVRIGQYKTKPQAVKVQTAMKRRYKKNTNVNRSAIVAR